MSVDLTFWKYQNGTYLDPAAVYQASCCDGMETEGLESLPLDEILSETAAVFCDWKTADPFDYEKAGCGSFQISATPQTVRFDCYSMKQEDMKRFSSLMSKFGCPLYDPQSGVRFDKISLFFIDEAGEYQAQAEQTLSRLLPRLEMITQSGTWEDSLQHAKSPASIKYDAVIHRAKTLTKVTSTMRFGSAWASRACSCKTALLTEQEASRRLLGELLQKSMERVVKDFLDRTYYE